MTEEERVLLEWHLWVSCWLYATPTQRTELLVLKARIEAATGYQWSPPYVDGIPPRLVLPPGA